MKTEHHTPAGKFQRLLDYMQRIGLDAGAIARTAGLDMTSIQRMAKGEPLPSYRYSCLYEHAATEMQRLNLALPWGAGIGTDAFRFMCYAVITCRTLREALQRAERYERMLYPLTRYRIALHEQRDRAELEYMIDSETASEVFSPENWDRTLYLDTVAKASGLRVWHAFMGWLIGRDIELDAVALSAPEATAAHTASLEEVFRVPVQFEAEKTALHFDASHLDYKTVHTPESLEAFLDNAIYALIVQDSHPASTGAAIRSLLAKSPAGGPPSFEQMAEDLHMSPSSLRRRLQKEDTSYQQLKDQYRCGIAIRHLREGELKIQEIGELLGFLEPGSFIRSFRGWTGVTPNQFRQQLAQKDVE